MERKYIFDRISQLLTIRMEPGTKDHILIRVPLVRNYNATIITTPINEHYSFIRV